MSEIRKPIKGITTEKTEKLIADTLAEMPERADLVFKLNKQHQIEEVHLTKNPQI